ncbi:MAG: hypothetical protein FIA97_11405 [Methylococcaceae bacterium]|nr:hypothetical protein [Methylococcaceae bacterium]
MGSLNPLRIRLQLRNVHCFDEGDSAGNAEPYLWTVFFKIDGDTVRVGSDFRLQGRATVVATPGNQGDLATNVDAGDDLPIAPQLGLYRTFLQPIPIENFPETVSGIVGAVVVLLEEDNTPGDAIGKGHEALNASLQRELDALIPTLGIQKQDVTPEEEQGIKDRVTDAVTRAITEDVSVWEWLGGGGDMDDTLGAAIFRFSHRELRDSNPGGLGLSRRMSETGNLLEKLSRLSGLGDVGDLFAGNGDWEVSGTITAQPIPYSIRRLLATVGADPGLGLRSPFGRLGVATVRELIEAVA